MNGSGGGGVVIGLWTLALIAVAMIALLAFGAWMVFVTKRRWRNLFDVRQGVTSLGPFSRSQAENSELLGQGKKTVDKAAARLNLDSESPSRDDQADSN